MKRYIYAAIDVDIDYDPKIFEGTPFECDTGISWGNEFLNKEELKYKQTAKNRTGAIVRMTPSEYFADCSRYGFSKYIPTYELKLSRRDDLVEQYKADMQAGDKFPMCYINYADRTQEGLHRMMAAGDVYGWDTRFPVLAITAYDPDIEARNKLAREAYDFQDDTFKKICGWALRRISNYTQPVPDDFIQQYQQAIITEATEWFKDIDVEVELDTVEEHQQVNVYLTRYNDYDFDGYLSNPYTAWLADYYDTDE